MLGIRKAKDGRPGEFDRCELRLANGMLAVGPPVGMLQCRGIDSACTSLLACVSTSVLARAIDDDRRLRSLHSPQVAAILDLFEGNPTP